MSDTYSPTYLKPFAYFDQDTQSLKTLEDTLISDLTPFSGILPQSGMMRNGVLFERPKPVQHIKELGYLSLPTPLASDAENPLTLRNQMNITKALRMLPTPRAQEPGSTSEGYGNGLRETARMSNNHWEQFEPAIKRWEQVIGRPAPSPLVNQRLNPKFTEWLMGLPEGWITDLDISWNQMIKACGNGVVPQQAKLALERLVK